MNNKQTTLVIGGLFILGILTIGLWAIGAAAPIYPQVKSITRHCTPKLCFIKIVSVEKDSKGQSSDRVAIILEKNKRSSDSPGVEIIVE